MSSAVPRMLRTQRLQLRPWSPADAAALLPVLEANVAHIGPWIPKHVSTPVPLPELEQRLAGFAAEFEANLKWRYALLASDDDHIIGEVGLFPRDATGRVAFEAADRGEIGYWLDAGVTGRGLAMEATRAMMEVAQAVPTFTHVEIRCDAANIASARIPQRLGFELTGVEEELQVWRKRLERNARASA